MARKQHKYHYIYKTKCSITGRYYIGMHSTSNLEDGYLGSGRRLWLSINKHGKENHTKEILEFLENRQALKDREHQLVNDDVLKDPMCMNLCVGGSGWPNNGKQIGGDKFRTVNQYMKEHPEILSKRATRIFTAAWKTPEFREKMSTKKPFLNREHSPETKKKIAAINSVKQIGFNNSQFGTIWITNGIENQKIKKGQNLQPGWKKGRTNYNKHVETSSSISI